MLLLTLFLSLLLLATPEGSHDGGGAATQMQGGTDAKDPGMEAHVRTQTDTQTDAETVNTETQIQTQIDSEIVHRGTHHKTAKDVRTVTEIGEEYRTRPGLRTEAEGYGTESDVRIDIEAGIHHSSARDIMTDAGTGVHHRTGKNVSVNLDMREDCSTESDMRIDGETGFHHNTGGDIRTDAGIIIHHKSERTDIMTDATVEGEQHTSERHVATDAGIGTLDIEAAGSDKVLTRTGSVSGREEGSALVAVTDAGTRAEAKTGTGEVDELAVETDIWTRNYDSKIGTQRNIQTGKHLEEGTGEKTDSRPKEEGKVVEVADGDKGAWMRTEAEIVAGEGTDAKTMTRTETQTETDTDTDTTTREATQTDTRSDTEIGRPGTRTETRAETATEMETDTITGTVTKPQIRTDPERGIKTETDTLVDDTVLEGPRTSAWRAREEPEATAGVDTTILLTGGRDNTATGEHSITWGRPNTQGAHFDPNTEREVTVMVGQRARLPCTVLDLDTRHVSWIRQRDLHIMTVGIFTYTRDDRFKVYHPEGSDDWHLDISSTTFRDAGVYECQVSTSPKISLPVTLSVQERRRMELTRNQYPHDWMKQLKPDWRMESRWNELPSLWKTITTTVHPPVRGWEPRRTRQYQPMRWTQHTRSQHPPERRKEPRRTNYPQEHKVEPRYTHRPPVRGWDIKHMYSSLDSVVEPKRTQLPPERRMKPRRYGYPSKARTVANVAAHPPERRTKARRTQYYPTQRRGMIGSHHSPYPPERRTIPRRPQHQTARDTSKPKSPKHPPERRTRARRPRDPADSEREIGQNRHPPVRMYNFHPHTDTETETVVERAEHNPPERSKSTSSCTSEPDYPCPPVWG